MGFSLLQSHWRRRRHCFSLRKKPKREQGVRIITARLRDDTSNQQQATAARKYRWAESRDRDIALLLILFFFWWRTSTSSWNTSRDRHRGGMNVVVYARRNHVGASTSVDRDDDSSRRKSGGWWTDETWNFADPSRDAAWRICLSFTDGLNDRDAFYFFWHRFHSGESVPRSSTDPTTMTFGECSLEICSLIQERRERRVKHRAVVWAMRQATRHNWGCETEGEYRRRSSSWSTLDTRKSLIKSIVYPRSCQKSFPGRAVPAPIPFRFHRLG